MKIKCPRCGKETTFQGNPFRPFCSERCKLVDLDHWTSESYRVPARSSDEEEDGVPKPPTDSSET